MQIQQERQLNPVSDEVMALTAVVRPILTGVLYAIKTDIAKEAGGYENIKLKMLPRLYRPGDGDCGISFEYAVHDALNRQDGRVLERISDAIKLCRINGSSTRSILFGAEKKGALQLIDTAKEILTDDSTLRYGTQGRPAKLRRHLDSVVAAFKNPRTRHALPYSISGLRKADLFVGCSDSDHWVGTSVKINAAALEGAKGLRVGIVPSRQGRSDNVRKDEAKNLIVCPLAHDEDFMQTPYEGWRIVQAFIAADANEPREVLLPRPADREVARLLAERREFALVDVVDAISHFAQPELLETKSENAELEVLKGDSITGAVLAPIARGIRRGD